MLRRVLSMAGNRGGLSSEWGVEMATLGVNSSENASKDGDEDGMHRSTASDHSLPTEFNFLLCRLCYRRLHNPRILYCWHAFCHHCISGHLGSDDKLTCPLCGITTRVPKIGLDALYYRTAEFLSRMSQTCSAVTVCDLDLEIRHHCHHRAKSFRDPAQCLLPCTRMCRSCEEYLCEECSPLHLIEMHLSRNSICQQHGEPELSFCEDCREMACGICTEIEHLYHDITGLSEKADAYRSEARDLIRKCREGRWKLDDDLQAMVQKARAEIQEEAKSVIESLTKTVKAKESVLLSQVDDFAMEMWIKIQEAKQQHGPRTDEHEGLIELGQNLLTCGSNKEIVQIYHHLHHRLTETTAAQSPQEVPEQLLQQVDFIRHRTPQLDEETLLGRVTFWDPGAERARAFRRRSFMPSWLLEESDSEAGNMDEDRRKSSGTGARMMEAILDIGKKYREEIGRRLSAVSTVSTDSLTSIGGFSSRRSSYCDATDEDQQPERRPMRQRRLSVPVFSNLSLSSLVPSLRSGEQGDTNREGKARTRRFSLFPFNRNKHEMPQIIDDEDIQAKQIPASTPRTLPLEGTTFHDLDNPSSDSDKDRDEIKEETLSDEEEKERCEKDGEGQSGSDSDSAQKTERKRKKKSRLGRLFRRGRSSHVARGRRVTASDIDESVMMFLDAGLAKNRRRSMSLPTNLHSPQHDDKHTPSQVEDGGRLDPMRWVGKRKEDIRRFRKRFGQIGGSFLKSIKGKDDSEEQAQVKLHPWDVQISPSTSTDEEVPPRNSTDEDAPPTIRSRKKLFGQRLPVAGFSSVMKTLSEEDRSSSKDNIRESSEEMNTSALPKTGESESSDEDMDVFDTSRSPLRIPFSLSRFRSRTESSEEEGTVSAPETSIFRQLPKNRAARARRFSVF